MGVIRKGLEPSYSNLGVKSRHVLVQAQLMLPLPIDSLRMIIFVADTLVTSEYNYQRVEVSLQYEKTIIMGSR